MEMDTSRQSQRSKRLFAVNVALVATTALSLLKVWASAYTGSISVLGEAIHSGLDLLSSLLTRLVVGLTEKPADEDRPYGYGKLEALSALFEAVLLFMAGGFIVYESLVHYHKGETVDHINMAIYVTLISMAVNIYVYFLNRDVGKREESLAIETNSYHFLADFFTSVGLLLGLSVIKFTGLYFLDSIFALALALYIFAVSFAQMKKCVNELSDVALSDDDLGKIRKILSGFSSRILDYHDLKTRKVGKMRHVEMHLSVCSQFTVEHAHSICDDIESQLLEVFPAAHVSIHIEPCSAHKASCKEVCDISHISKMGEDQ